MNTRKLFKRALTLGVVVILAVVLTDSTARVARADEGMRAGARVPGCRPAPLPGCPRATPLKSRRKPQRGRNTTLRVPKNSDPLSRRKDLKKALARLS